MRTPLISVVMAVHNAQPFLQQALDSIFAQNLTDFELIVIDDASTDSSLQVLTNCREPRLILLRNDQNQGLTQSLNKGLAAARGQYIARHDADDFSEPKRFHQQAAFLEKEPRVGLIGTNHYFVDRQNRVLDTVEYPCSNEDLKSLLMKQNCFCHGAVMYRKSCIEAVGGYRTEFRVTQDYDLWLRIAEHFDLANLPSFLYNFRLHTDTISHNKTDLQVSYEYLARKLAEKRRAGIPEGAFPGEAVVINSYPRQAQRSFEDNLNKAYYFFAAGEHTKATEALEAAEASTFEKELDFMGWEEWATGKARRLAALREDIEAGQVFIRWVFQSLRNVSNKKAALRNSLSNFYADQAFQAYENTRGREVYGYAVQAIYHDWRWLQNRGLLVIMLRSILGIVVPKRRSIEKKKR